MFETESVPTAPVINQNQIPMNENQSTKPKTPKLIIPIIIVIVLGVATGYLTSGKKTLIQNTVIKSGVVNKSDIIVGTEFGGKDETIFKDQAIGVVETGGLNGEGTHKLLREGGPSQTVYLTSSTLELEQFTGRKVQIWGETFKAQKAGWLMDVGRLKVLE